VVICTGSVHHIPYERQVDAIEVFARGVKPDGLVIISDCYIDDYADEQGRKLAAAKLGYEYLSQTITNGAPEPVVKDTAEIMVNDVLMNEFKTSIKKRQPVFDKYFGEVETIHTWPQTSAEYGDYVTVCRSPRMINLSKT
jgi:2-polyprenyl-3-methyl-5-hydroxy-6-metoxy-1,4-benzoquinol methylase